MATVTVHVKHGSSTLQASLAPDAKVTALQEELERQTGVFVRHQKLIHKGKVLEGGQRLTECGVTDGSKLMLMASQGAQTKGQEAAQTAKKQKQADAEARVRQAYAKVAGGTSAMVASTSGRGAAAAAATGGVGAPVTVAQWEERRRAWQKTGIVSLQGLALAQLPAHVLEAGLEGARLADLSSNRLAAVPESVGRMAGLHTLKLSNNCLQDAGMPWAALCSLGGLTSLWLDHNCLTSLPESLGQLSRLQRLSVAANKITALPGALGSLGGLEVLAADDNMLQELPDSLGSCSSLVELSACSNAISAIPDSFARLAKLQALRLDNNRIKVVPPAVLEQCTSLSLLSLPGNAITADQLRSTRGFDQYNQRRIARGSKQLDSMALADTSAIFSEGADQSNWQRWKD